MRKLSLNIRLLIVFIVILMGFIISNFCFTTSTEKEYVLEMHQAVKLTESWFKIIEHQKEINDIHTDAITNIPNHYLLGDDFTMTTTTLGSLNAKEISTNPEFAALMVRLIKESKIKEYEKVGLIISGSFPSLAISTLAALQTLDHEVILMSSLGASSYGANQEGASWLDMENWLIDYGDLKYKSIIVSKGAENDIGLGLTDEGNELLQRVAELNGVELYEPESLLQSIQSRTSLLNTKGISLLINIGGNQAAMGGCAHAISIPNGLHQNIQLCDDEDRGVIQEINSLGVPIINLLNIKDLANTYHMDIAPGITYSESTELYKETKKNKLILSISLIIGLCFLILSVPKRNETNENKL